MQMGDLSDDLKAYASTAFSTVIAQKSVKASLIASAVKGVSGIPPIVDTKTDPNVTWVRLLPAHGEYIDGLFLKNVKEIGAGASKSDANVKMDVMPALFPFLQRRVLPFVLIASAGLIYLGYHYGSKKKRKK